MNRTMWPEPGRQTPESHIIRIDVHWEIGVPLLLDFFEETYISGRQIILPNRGHRQIAPQFPPELWCVHDKIFNNFNWTNNYSEGWNMNYKLAVGHAHPTIWASIRAIQVDNEEVLTKIAQNNIGRPPTKKRQGAYEDLQHRLHNLYSVASSFPGNPGLVDEE